MPRPPGVVRTFFARQDGECPVVMVSIPPPPPRAQRVPVGYLSKAHGIRGELVLVLTEAVEHIEGPVFLRHRNGGPERPFTVERARRHHGSLLISLEGVLTRNDAELLRSHTVLLNREDLASENDDAVFLGDFSGLAVFVLGEDGTETALGVIEEATAPAGQILWSIRTPEGREVLLPAVPEFVRDIDPQAGKVRIAPPPGLLELYLSS